MTAHGNAHVAKQHYYVDYGVAYDINVTARRRQSERDQERDTLIAIGKEEKSKKKKESSGGVSQKEERHKLRFRTVAKEKKAVSLLSSSETELVHNGEPALPTIRIATSATTAINDLRTPQCACLRLLTVCSNALRA